MLAHRASKKNNKKNGGIGMSEHKCCVCNRWISSEYISENYVNESDTICKKFEENFTPTHKISSLSASLYSKPNKKFKLKNKISFCSLVKITNKKKENDKTISFIFMQFRFL